MTRFQWKVKDGKIAEMAGNEFVYILAFGQVSIFFVSYSHKYCFLTGEFGKQVSKLFYGENGGRTPIISQDDVFREPKFFGYDQYRATHVVKSLLHILDLIFRAEATVKRFGSKNY